MRRYASRLRDEQAEQTRDRILEAFAGELGEGAADFRIQRVAERAGVGVRTVYHHFPTRDVQIDAVATWLEARVAGEETGPQSLDDLPAYAERMYRLALDHEAATRASLAPGVAQRVRTRRRQKRLDQIDRVVKELGLRAGDARRLAAVIKGLISADFGFGLIDRYGLSRDDAVAAVRWTVEALVAEARRHARRA